MGCARSRPQVSPSVVVPAPEAPVEAPAPGTSGERGKNASDYMIDMANISIGRQIGIGSTKSIFEGTVHSPFNKLYKLAPGEKIAILRIRQNRDIQREGFPREAASFIRIGPHPHLVAFFGVGLDHASVIQSEGKWRRITLLTEFAPLGSLDTVLEQRGRAEVPLHCAVEILQQVARAARHIAEAGFVHTDISLRNVLVFKYPERMVFSNEVKVKLGDLTGAISMRDKLRAAASLNSREAPNSCLAEPPFPAKRDLGASIAVRYAPPEVLEDRLFSEASDVWSFAVCAWEMFSDEVMPYLSIGSDEEVAQSVRAGLRLERPERCPPALWASLETCWAMVPGERPRFANLEEQLAVVHALIMHRPGDMTLPGGATPANVLRRMDELRPRREEEEQLQHHTRPSSDFLIMSAIHSLDASSLPEGVSEEMRLEHYRSRQQMIEQQARRALDTKLAMSMAPVTQPSQHQTPMTDRLPLVTQAPGPGAESPAPSAQPTAIWPPMAMAVAAPPPTTTLAVADKSEEELKFATALSLSDQTVHLPRIHAFFTSQSQWLEPISSFLRTVCTSKRPGCFAAFHAVIEELLVKHLLDVQPSRHEDHHGNGQSLTLSVFAQFCVLCSPGGLLDDVALIDQGALEQARLITLVESQERFEALLSSYAPTSSDESRVDPSRWDRYFAEHVDGISLLATSAANGRIHQLQNADLDMREHGFEQFPSSIDGGRDEVEDPEIVQRLRLVGAAPKESESLAAALRAARMGGLVC